MNNKTNDKKTDFSVMPINEIIAAFSALMMGFSAVAFTSGLSDMGQRMLAVMVTASVLIILIVFARIQRQSTARIIEAI